MATDDHGNVQPSTAPSAASEKGSTTPTTAAADSAPKGTWKKYVLPAVVGGAGAWLIGAPLLVGIGIGAASRLAWSRYSIWRDAKVG